MSKRDWRDSGLEALGVSKGLLRDPDVLEGFNDALRDIDEAIDHAVDVREAEASHAVDARVGDLDASIKDAYATISVADVLAPRGVLDLAGLGTALDRVNTSLDMTGLRNNFSSPMFPTFKDTCLGQLSLPSAFEAFAKPSQELS